MATTAKFRTPKTAVRARTKLVRNPSGKRTPKTAVRARTKLVRNPSGKRKKKGK